MCECEKLENRNDRTDISFGTKSEILASANARTGDLLSCAARLQPYHLRVWYVIRIFVLSERACANNRLADSNHRGDGARDRTDINFGLSAGCCRAIARAALTSESRVLCLLLLLYAATRGSPASRLRLSAVGGLWVFLHQLFRIAMLRLSGERAANRSSD